MQKPEPLEFGEYYHVYNRGINRERIFFEERNYGYFLQLYAQHVVPIAETYAYCLLPNHFHFLVRIRDLASSTGLSGSEPEDLSGRTGVRGEDLSGRTGVRGKDLSGRTGVRGKDLTGREGGENLSGRTGVRGKDLTGREGGENLSGRTGVRGKDLSGSENLTGRVVGKDLTGREGGEDLSGRGEGRRAPSQCFSNFYNAYAKGFNRTYNRTGSLFQRPFGRIRVSSDAYFVQLVVYVHHNAQKHSLVTDFRDWPHSSYHALLSEKPTRLEREAMLEWFGGLAGFEGTHGQEADLRLVAPLAGDDFD
jgi:REP element-mobilizing transposase RayT